MNKPMSQEQFASAFWAFVRNVAAVLTAIATILAVVVYLTKPQFDAYLLSQTTPLIDRLNAQNDRLSRLVQDMADIKKRLAAVQPFLEFEGRGAIVGRGPFEAGGVVPIEFFMRRNLPCSTQVIQQFFSATNGRVLSQFTVVVQSTRAPASFHPIPFIIEIAIPEGLPPGVYSYRAILRPDINECPGQTEVHAPPSNYFEVR